VNRLPTTDEVREFLRANAHRTEDDRWAVPPAEAPPVFEPAALKLAELCLLAGTPLSQVVTSDLALSLARRITVLEAKVAAIPAGTGAVR
jgi:hypothetical protein